MKSFFIKYEPFLKIAVSVFIISLFFNPGEKESGRLEEGIILQNIKDKYDIRNDVLILKDTAGKLKVEDVSRAPGNWGFMPADPKTFKAGFEETVFWFEFTLLNLADSEKRLLVLPRAAIQSGTLYTPVSPGRFNEDQFDKASLTAERGYSPKDIVLNLETHDKESSTFYLRMESEGTFQLPLYIWDEASYRTAAGNGLILTGVFTGFCLLLTLYYILQYTEKRKKVYLNFSLFSLAVLLTAGLTTDYSILTIFPSLIFMNESIMLLALGASNMSGISYLHSFLDKTADDKAAKKSANRLLLMVLLLLAFQFVSLSTSFVSMLLLTAANLIYSLLAIVKSRSLNKKYIRVQIASYCLFFTSLILYAISSLNGIAYYRLFDQVILLTVIAGVFLSSVALYIKDKTKTNEKEIRDNKMLHRLQMELESFKNLDASKNELLEVTAHSLRTPLYGMIGLAEALVEESRMRLLPNQSKQLEVISDYGKKMARKLNDLTDFSRIKQNTLDVNVESVGIHQLIDEVIEICRPLLKKPDIRLYSTLTKGLPEVVADPYRIQQILYNLIDNAIRHTNEGEIVISAKENGTQLAVSVRDTGLGIDSSKLQHIFEPLKKGEGSDIGIGLSISKRLIELHGGWLRAESQINSGSIFTFALPISSSEAAEDLPVIEEIGEAELRQSLGLNIRSNKKVRVLIAEKEPLDRNILIQQLQKENYDAIGTGSGSEAFQLLNDQPFDLVILDWTLADMSGNELCRKIREKYVMTELPVLMLSTKIGLQEKMDAFTAGANDYLVKPCDKEEFLLRMDTLSNLQALTREITDMNDVLERNVKEKTMALEITNMNLVTVNDEIQEIEKSRNEMLSSISHELGTPITLIHSYIQAVQESLIDEKNPRYLDMIHKKLLLLERLTEDLVELGKYKSGNMTLRFESIPFTDWFRKIITGLEADIRQSGRLFEWTDLEMEQSEMEAYQIFLDKDRIDQVFSNILWNAVKNTSSTDGKITVFVQLCTLFEETETIAEDQADAEIIFRISDTGQGIPAEILPHIFDRFFKLENNSGKKGSGLGLAIAKEIVLSHKGRIWAESEMGVGSSFFIALPLYK